jgi:hypothetical protein
MISADRVRGIILINVYIALFVPNPISYNFFHKPVPELVSRVQSIYMAICHFKSTPFFQKQSQQRFASQLYLF